MTTPNVVSIEAIVQGDPLTYILGRISSEAIFLKLIVKRNLKHLNLKIQK